MKMMNLKYIIIFLSVILLNTSCKKDWFDVKSDKNLAVPATLQDFEYLLDNYEVMVLVSPALSEIASDGHYMPESRWQSLSNSVEAGAWKNAYTWSNTFIYTNLRDWNWNYRKIFQCNLVLDGLRKLNQTVDPDRFNQIKGNALFHRAKSFYDLAQIYGQPYKSGAAAEDLGIPLKEGIDIAEVAKRATVQETYDKIIADLIEAAELLPLRPLYLTRGSKLACYGLLARVYLTMGNFERAGFYANALLQQQSRLIDFNDIPTSNADMGLFNDEVVFHSVMINQSPVFGSNYIFVDQSLYDLFHSNDLRKTRFFTLTANGILFKGMYNNTVLPFSGLAIDEMYLIRAECYAREGDISLAMKDLNVLLRSRWEKNPDGTSKYEDQTASDELGALSIILLERRKELLLRGLRWADLRRLNQEERFKVTLTRTVGGKTYILEPNSYQYTFPLPDDEMSFSNMEQNPGWN